MLADMASLFSGSAFSRRSFLLGGTAALAWSQTRAPVCSLSAEQEEGPYYIDERTVRRNITEGKPGVPLQLRVVLLDAKRCLPLQNAIVDIWHCDALGVYSGFTAMNGNGPPGGPLGRPPFGPPGADRPDGPGPSGFGPGEFRSSMPPGPPNRHLDATRYLRGLQGTDKLGRVEFASLYPGWYQGRTIHIHLKVHTDAAVKEATYSGGHVCHTGQLFFPEDITADVAKLEPYATRLQVHRTLQSEDGVFRGQHGDGSIVEMARLDSHSNAGGFLATVTLAVDPEATPARVAPFGPGGPAPPGRFDPSR